MNFLSNETRAYELALTSANERAGALVRATHCNGLALALAEMAETRTGNDFAGHLHGTAWHVALTPARRAV